MLITVGLTRDHLEHPPILVAAVFHHAVDLTQHRFALGNTSLEKLFHSRQATGDIDTRDTACVEGTHRELRTRLTNGLRCDDANRIADLHYVMSP